MTTLPQPSELRRVRIWGHEVRVAVRPGDSDGPPLLVCNGIGASLDLLDPFVDALDPAIEVIRFDVPGVGGSPLPSVPYSFPMLAAFCGAMMTELGHDRFDVLGISWGGGLAQQIAFQMPRRCRRAVLVSTATGALMVPASPRVLSRMITPRRYRDKDYAQHVAALLYGGMARTDPARASKLLHASSRVGPRRGYLYQLLAGSGWTSLWALPAIRQPVLILAGSDDPIIPLVNARIIARLLPHATLHVYDDGHLGLVTSAAELAPVVADHLRD